MIDINKILPEQDLTTGQRVADLVAKFGGSWMFIISFAFFMGLWMLFNSIFPPFDPFPFILLNLILSSLASVQAPVIMMSQNRQEERERMKTEKDLQLDYYSMQQLNILEIKIKELSQQISDLQSQIPKKSSTKKTSRNTTTRKTR